MLSKIEQLKQQLSNEIDSATSAKLAYDLKLKYITGKTALVTELMKTLGALSKEERPQAGKVINEFKDWAQEKIDNLEKTMQQKELQERYQSEVVDITLPGESADLGSLHPVTIINNKIIDLFMGMGFEVYNGPEVEVTEYNFDKLNVSQDHPSRDMQDTFYLAENIVLRTHTSPGQIRTMLSKKPPIKVLVPGRVFRPDDDATQTPMFKQLEGLVVDKNVSLCDFQGMLNNLAKAMFNNDTKTRFRPSYFPFTEPSVEVDVSCFECGGTGHNCRLCKGSGWIEILGGGMVNRNVLLNCGIDPEEYSAFAFGLGIDRIAMLKYGLNNIHILTDNDKRTLKQFTKEGV